ncbi:MAG: phospholipase D-like domain-containing protein [Fimbriiglobus sp.]|jgi:phosphatidylserine/phosphatidylglycerophosphate/cardiolipin synthase-like enzyme|nr:phospholipase D-like domain-containing protein [Fimbriiglobus sp.]
MNAAELDALLRQFMVDHKLSDTEKKALARWVETNVTTEQKRGVARSRVFATARHAVSDPQAVQIIDFLEDVLKVLLPMGGATPTSAAPDEAFFSPGDTCLGRIVSRLNGARRTADICVFTITDDRITTAILAAYKRGVKVRIITDNDKAFDEGSDVRRLQEAGIPLLVDHTPYHMHHKFALIDRSRLINGSYNWTRSAATSNEENITDTGDPALLAAFQREFDSLWQKLS